MVYLEFNIGEKLFEVRYLPLLLILIFEVKLLYGEDKITSMCDENALF